MILPAADVTALMRLPMHPRRCYGAPLSALCAVDPRLVALLSRYHRQRPELEFIRVVDGFWASGRGHRTDEAHQLYGTSGEYERAMRLNPSTHPSPAWVEGKAVLSRIRGEPPS